MLNKKCSTRIKEGYKTMLKIRVIRSNRVILSKKKLDK